MAAISHTNYMKARSHNLLAPAKRPGNAFSSFCLSVCLSVCTYVSVYELYVQGGPKMAPFLYALISSNINQFSQLSHCQNQDKILIILSLKIPPHLKCVAVLACETSIVLKATTENKTTSVTTHYTC